MKILFVNHIPEQYVKDQDPLGIMSLTAVLKQAGHEVSICSPRMSEVEKKLEHFPAQVIGYSITTGEHNFYRKFNKLLKKKWGNIFSLFGGPHPTFTPAFLKENQEIDAICLGEGDYSVVDFINRYESQKDYHLTPNFHVRYEGRIFENPINNLIENLDNLPFPDRDIIYSNYPYARKRRMKNFITMRGCPYQCSYCFNHQYKMLYKGKGNLLRRRSVDNVISEILLVREKYPLEFVYFRDDNFTLFPEWVKEFSEKYSKKVNLPFACSTRLKPLSEGTVNDLKKANCVTVEVGIEAGNSRVRNEILKRNMSDNEILEGVTLFRSKGIKVLSENIFGIPGSSLQDDLETYRLNLKCKVNYPNSRLLQPYFGTKIYHFAEKMGQMDKDIQKIQPDDYLKGKTILNISNIRERKRLNKIFAISVFLGLPLPFVKLLIRLPINPIYYSINLLFKGYSGTVLYNYKKNIQERLHNIYQVLKMNNYFSGTEIKD